MHALRPTTGRLAAVCLAVFCFLYCLGGQSQAPVGYVTLSGGHLNDSTGTPISNATISFAPVNNSVTPISYQINGNGQAIFSAVTAQVTTGAFTLQVADTARTVPLNVCFNTTVVDNTTGNVLLGPGYTCLQPASSGQAVTGSQAWCTVSGGATSCNFDHYQPTLTALAASVTGPAGPQGSTGPAGVTVAINSLGAAPSYFAFGDSITWGIAASSLQNAYPYWVSKSVLFPVLDLGQPGYVSQGEDPIIFAHWAGFPTGQPVLISYQIGTNNADLSGAVANIEQSFALNIEAQYAALAIPYASKIRFNTGSVTYGGSWSASSLFGANTPGKQCVGLTCTATFSLPATTAFILVTGAQANSNSAAATLTCDSVATGATLYFQPYGGTSVPGNNGAGNPPMTMPVLVTGLANTTHSCTVASTSSTGTVDLEWVAPINASVISGAPLVLAGAFPNEAPPATVEQAYRILMQPRVAALIAAGLTNLVYVDTVTGASPVSVTAWSIPSFSVTSCTESGGAAVLTATNTLAAGNTVALSGFGNCTDLNAQTLTVSATGLSGSQFEVPSSGSASGSESATAAQQQVVFTGANSFVGSDPPVSGTYIALSGFGTSTFFNGATAQVLNVGLSGTKFEIQNNGWSGGATESGAATPTLLQESNINQGGLHPNDYGYYILAQPYISAYNSAESTTYAEVAYIGSQVANQSTSGFSNFGLDYGALASATTGQSNTAIGYDVLESLTTGSDNTAVGAGSNMASCTSCNQNVAIGTNALSQEVNTSGAVALGFEALYQETVGNQTAVGYLAEAASTTSTGSSAFGTNVLKVQTTGGNNTGVGFGALGAVTTNSNSTAMGASALAAANSSNPNSAFGSLALASDTSGGSNDAFGFDALEYNITGNDNDAFGYLALNLNTATGSTAMGYASLAVATSGGSNTAVGFQAGHALTTGSGLTALGFNAEVATTATGVTEDTAVGYDALGSMTSGTGNTAVGADAGYLGLGGQVALTTGSDNTFLGTLATVATGGAGFSHCIAIGYGATCAASDEMIIDPAVTLADFPAASLQANSLAGSSVAATFAAGAAAGSSPGTPACTTSHVCDSTSGVISFTMGSSTAAGALLTITTGITRSSQPNCDGSVYLVASPYTAVPLRLTETATTVVFNVGSAPSASTAYELVYQCFGN